MAFADGHNRLFNQTEIRRRIECILSFDKNEGDKPGVPDEPPELLDPVGNSENIKKVNEALEQLHALYKNKDKDPTGEEYENQLNELRKHLIALNEELKNYNDFAKRKFTQLDKYDDFRRQFDALYDNVGLQHPRSLPKKEALEDPEPKELAEEKLKEQSYVSTYDQRGNKTKLHHKGVELNPSAAVWEEALLQFIAAGGKLGVSKESTFLSRLGFGNNATIYDFGSREVKEDFIKYYLMPLALDEKKEKEKDAGATIESGEEGRKRAGATITSGDGEENSAKRMRLC